MLVGLLGLIELLKQHCLIKHPSKQRCFTVNTRHTTSYRSMLPNPAACTATHSIQRAHKRRQQSSLPRRQGCYLLLVTYDHVKLATRGHQADTYSAVTQAYNSRDRSIVAECIHYHKFAVCSAAGALEHMLPAVTVYTARNESNWRERRTTQCQRAYSV